MKGKLSHFQQLLLVLMKLRLNLEEQDLAYRFSVSQSTVSRVFRKWMYRISEQLKFLIHWPSREYLCATMPMGFKTFCVCILDCTDIFIERPSNLKARAQTWSEYKHLKVLVAITAQGTTFTVYHFYLKPGGCEHQTNVSQNIVVFLIIFYQET